MTRRDFWRLGVGAWAARALAGAEAGMAPIDYGRSFLQGRWVENRVRFWVESRTRVIDPQRTAPIDYYQCGSCKSENTFAPKELFHADNYDFLPIFGPEDGVIFRRKAWLNGNYRQVRKTGELWGGQDYKIVRPRKVRLLKTTREMRAATDAGTPLVAQTEVMDAGTGLRAIYEFPVKTMNIHDGRDLYQVDTGPVAFVDLSRRYAQTGEALRLAFVAFNGPGSADFILEAPTGITEGGKEITRVHHYSERRSVAAVNRVFACE